MGITAKPPCLFYKQGGKILTLVINKTLGSGNYTLKDVVVKASGNREKETVLLYDQKKAVVRDIIDLTEPETQGGPYPANGFIRM